MNFKWNFFFENDYNNVMSEYICTEIGLTFI